jgi:hypothetical protein
VPYSPPYFEALILVSSSRAQRGSLLPVWRRRVPSVLPAGPARSEFVRVPITASPSRRASAASGTRNRAMFRGRAGSGLSVMGDFQKPHAVPKSLLTGA